MNGAPDHRGAVEYYVGLLRAGDFEGAFFGLIDLDDEVLPDLFTAHAQEAEPAVRSGILRIIWEFRTPEAVPLLLEQLRDRNTKGWRAALDGLVTLASFDGIAGMEAAIRSELAGPNPDADYVFRVTEALGQAREAMMEDLHADESP
jgi:HEAT repeat protein